MSLGLFLNFLGQFRSLQGNDGSTPRMHNEGKAGDRVGRLLVLSAGATLGAAAEWTA